MKIFLRDGSYHVTYKESKVTMIIRDDEVKVSFLSCSVKPLEWDHIVVPVKDIMCIEER